MHARRQCLAVLLVSLVLGAVAVLPAQSLLANGGFETGVVGEPPPSWVAIEREGFRFAVTDEGCIEGSQCAVITADPSISPGAIGVLRSSIVGPDLAARRVRFRAAARVEAGATAQMWMRVDRPDGGFSFFDNMANRPIRGTSWTYYTIDATVDIEATNVLFGIFLRTPGTAWFDDATLEVTDELLTEPAEGPRPFSDEGLENVVAFGKLAGYVRYFHPSDQATEADWDTFLIQGVRQVEGAATPQDLASRLQAIFDPVAPTVRVYVSGADKSEPSELRLSAVQADSVTRWFHRGLGIGTITPSYNSSRQSARISNGEIPASHGNPFDVYEAPLARGISARVPTSLFSAEGRTLPRRDLRAASEPWARTLRDRATRLVNVIITWNVLQHFYPYFHITEVDMPSELRRALSAAAEQNSRRDFLATMDRLVAAVKDGHGDVTDRGEPIYTVPLVWRRVDGQVIVVRVKDAQGQEVKPGDRVLSVDGVAVEPALAEIEAHSSAATPQFLRYRALRRLARCDASEQRMSLELEPYDNPGGRHNVSFDCRRFASDWSEPRPDTVAELEPGILYVNIDRLTAEEFSASLSRMQEAQGIVFDMRGYPEFYPPTWVQHLVDVPADSELFNYPTPRLPDQTDLTFEQSFFTLSPRQPRLTAKTVFLTDASVLSQPETDLDWIEHYRLGEFLGGATAGTTGNINRFDLPGGFRVIWTGMRVLKQDGSRFHGVGIRPTIPVMRSRRGVAQGRDELLLAGIEIAKGPKPGPAPLIASGAIVNAATFASGPVAPGEMVTIFGSGLGPAELASSKFDFSGYLENYTGETRVFIDRIQAPMVHASANQVTALVPYGVSEITTVQVEYQGRLSNDVVLAVADVAPGLFAFGADQAAAVNQDNTFNSAANPALRGEILTLFGTGEGRTNPAAIDGKLPPVGRWPIPVMAVEVSFGGFPGEIVFQGVRTGVLQINVRIPQAAPSGPAVPVLLTVGGDRADGTRTVALR